MTFHPSAPPRPAPPVPPQPLPDPPMGPGPRISLRIGSPPRLPRRQRIARVLVQIGRYALAWIAVGAACFWIADVRLFVPGLAIAAMAANPWRPKNGRPRVRQPRVCDSTPGEGLAANSAPSTPARLAVRTISLPALLPRCQAGTPPNRARAA